VLAAGALYPIMYLRQNFEVSLLEALRINASDFGDLNFTLGVVFAVSYIPREVLHRWDGRGRGAIFLWQGATTEGIGNT
jgi:hypothetical protein